MKEHERKWKKMKEHERKWKKIRENKIKWNKMKEIERKWKKMKGNERKWKKMKENGRNKHPLFFTPPGPWGGKQIYGTTWGPYFAYPPGRLGGVKKIRQSDFVFIPFFFLNPCHSYHPHLSRSPGAPRVPGALHWGCLCSPGAPRAQGWKARTLP